MGPISILPYGADGLTNQIPPNTVESIALSCNQGTKSFSKWSNKNWKILSGKGGRAWEWSGLDMSGCR